MRKVPRGHPLYKVENETPLFSAHGCALMERPADGRFHYRAVNLKSGKSVKLGNSGTRLTERQYIIIAEQMSKCSASDFWMLADTEQGSVIGKGRLEDILKTTFNSILPEHGFLPRKKQIELAGEILDALCSIGISLAEAEVGIGKTLAYILPAVLIRRGRVNSGKIGTASPQNGAEKPIVIATSSIALQRAIEQDYIPALSDILMKAGIIKTPLTSALRKGKGNYVCERRLSNFAAHANPQTKTVVAPLLSGQTFDLASVKGLTPYIKRNICVDKRCGKDCPKYGQCRYMRHLDVVRRGGFDFQVCNHNYLLADIIHRNKGLNPLLPDYQAIVIDEAHKFLDAARVMYGSELPLAELCGVIKDIRSYTFVPGQSTAEIVRETDRLLSKSRLLFEMLGREVPEPESDEESERSATKIRQRAEKLIRAMKEDADALTALLEARTVIPKYTSSFTAAIRSLRKISEALGEFIRHGDLVYWLEERAEYSAFELRDAGFRLNTLCGIPKNLSTLLHRDLWSMNIPIILTSGTLSAAGSFEHMKRKTGINLLPARRLSETTKPSPFNHRENALIYVSENTPFPNNDDPSYIGSIAAEVERLVSASNGHAAVLFTSYKAMDMVWGKISARKLPYPLFRLNRGGAEVIEQFKRSGNGILFAAGALWEGIDIPGDILSMLIIVRLPFAVPDPVSEWEKTLYPSMSAYKTQVIVPEMLVKLKQGFGRLIRIESDIGVVALLDFRMRSDGAYRSDALRALPLCRVTDSIAEVQDFLLLKKPPEYFSTKALAC